MIAFSLVGVDSQGLTVITFHLPVPDGLFIYNQLFQRLVIGFWLTWAATILALISTAGLFPDFLSGGSIDVYLPRPMSRARLFITKYIAGLTFVTLQVLIVVAGGFVVLGLRAHEWKPRLFWAIPIVVCFFSYLFAICVFLGVKTRSTIAALLLTILCWTMFTVIDYAEPGLLAARNLSDSQAKQERSEAQFATESLRRIQGDPNATAMIPVLRQNVDTSERQARDDESAAKWWGFAHRAVYALKSVTPKTTDTIDFLESSIFLTREEKEAADRALPDNGGAPGSHRAAIMSGAQDTVKELNSRSVVWIIGTSLLFEAVVVGGAMWIFCQRDY
jgi:hypothetical protein